MKALSSLLAALLLAATPAGAAPIAQRELLGNGVTLLVAERSAIPIVSVSVSLRAGSAFDPPDAPGLASLTADLLTRGTARRSGPELDRAIEFVGGGLEADAGKDGVMVSLAVLKKDLALGLDLLAEVLREPAFPEDELKRRVAEVQAALKRSEENPETVAGRELGQLLYPGHPYAHPTPGTVESVGTLTREQVVRFHREHYRPDAAVIAVVGDVTRDEIRRELERRLAGWAPPAAPPAAIPSAIAALPPAVARTLTRDLTQATVYLGRPAIRQDHPDYFPLAVASYVLGGGSASRLYTRVREDRGLAYSIYSSLSPARYGASFVVGLQTRNEAVDEAVRLAQEEMRRMGREEVAAAELELARAYLVGSFPLRMDTSGKVARLMIAVEEHGLGLDYPDRYRERIGRVTAADVQRVSARYLDPAQFSVVTVRGRTP
ncbi:MAG: hypothetical protein A2X52_21430 [Candidatus Rokubacteria bacterium GWC2_70_16]|nr:MAG: hypothetical protein A2X52_21430 [Candidatus Rokubacteria bacterium GWC2_70_16]OGL15717.1 MAG: hypothetical protein A3K12_00605 [Candidatus Rokubacteria bacterium RIFCSPLOWO2_12_FULL_71_19]